MEDYLSFIRESREISSILEDIRDVFFILDKDRKIIFINTYAEEIFGFRIQKLLGSRIDKFMESSSLKKARDQFDYYLKLAKDKKEMDIPLLQYEFLDINKKRILGELKMKFLFNSNNSLIGIQGVLRSISERTEEKEKLKKTYNELKQLESIINKSPGIVFLWKNEMGWPVEFVSENIDQFEYTSEEFYSQKVKYIDIIHPEDRERVAKEVESHSDNGEEEFTQEYRILTKSGKCRWVDDRTWIRRNQNGEITHYQGIILNITKRKEMEKELKISESNFREAYSRSIFYKDLFVHDINNILHAINSSAEMIDSMIIRQEKTYPAMKDFKNITDIIGRQIDRGIKLIHNVQLISKLDAKEFEKKPVDLCSQITEAIKYVRKAYPQKQLEIKIKEKISDAKVLGNEFLQDIFENLFINSIKHNDNDLIEIIVNVFKEKVNDQPHYRLEFKDNGRGISDENKAVLFEKKKKNKNDSKGMGLGLSLVKQILDKLNGKILVKSRNPKNYTEGTKFIIYLPEAK
ncbi:MAG: putative Signal transduction histidine kinase [Promethearchaeota archaeon]|nr:MAG: putative Signal transduction histidine kinase [Candidatus Lokiarchaeota archaeon]